VIDITIVDQGYSTLRSLWDETQVKNNTIDCLPDVAYGFWHAGNTLDTLMDYLGRMQPEGYAETAADLAGQGVKIFEQVIGVDPTQCHHDQTPPTKAWRDDYGWWGIAFLKVHLLTSDLPSNPGYLNAARMCWSFMNKGGRQYPVTNESEKGGTWNHEGGDQNVITNALFLHLSAQLYNRTHEELFLTEARAQYGWFDYHLKHGAKYSVPSDSPAWLIHQLPLKPDMGLWTGDQGVLLGGLMSLRKGVLSSDPTLAEQLQDMCDAIVRGVTLSDQMVWKDTEVLHEAQPQSNSDDQWRYDLNGSVGKGVLMRYLAAFLGKRCPLIDVNAAAVSRTLQEDGYFAVSWVGDSKETMNNCGCTNLGYLTRQCSGQDAMNASLLPPP